MTAPIALKSKHPEVAASRQVRVLDGIARGSLAVFLLFSMFSISIAQISLVAGLVAWLAKIHRTGAWREVRWPVAVPFLLFVAASLLAVAFAEDPLHAAPGLRKLLQMLIFFWALNLIRDEADRDRWALLLIGVACVAALYGLYQALDAGVSLSTRVQGTLSVYMTFAGLLMLVGLLAFGRLLFRRPRESWLSGALCLMGLCLLVTLTRQAWLGVLVGGVFLVFLWRKKLLLAVPVLLVALVLFSPQAVRDRLHSMADLKDVTLLERFALWRVGWEVFKDHPVLGCGFNCLERMRGKYPDPTNILDRFSGVHSNVLQIMVDTGLLGLVTWSALWVCYLIAVYRRAPPDGGWAARAAAAVVLGFLAAGMFEVNFYDSEVAMVLYFIMALPFVRAGQARAGAGQGGVS